MLKNLLAIAVLFAQSALFAQSPIGTWQTIDDETGQAKSYVEIYEYQGKLCGRITKLLLKPQDTKCEKCSGERHNKPVAGMMIMWGLSQQGSTWKGGHIFDPEKDKTYGCSLWIESAKPNELKLRGHLGPFYRTQTWIRLK